MKVTIFLLLSAIAVIGIKGHDRGCVRIIETCSYDCPEGTHEYSGSCDGPTWSEPTCENPERFDLGGLCDYSNCYCDPPTVKDKLSNKCVHRDDCPKPTKTK